MTTDQELQLGLVAFQAIVKIVEAVQSAQAGTIDPQVALAAITTLHDALAANNAAADKAAAQKFDTP